MQNYLVNMGQMSSGIYRAYVIKRGDYRCFIPGLMNKNILNDSGQLDLDIYDKIKETLPRALFNSEAIKNLVDEDKAISCLVVFENGNNNNPRVMGFFGNSVKSVGGNFTNINNDFSNISEDTSFGLTGININGVNIRKNIMFNDSRTNSHQYLVIHTSVGPGATAQSIANSVKNQGLSVHGVIDDNGVLQTAEWTTRCAHCGNGNNVSIGFEQTESKHIKWNNKTWVPSWNSAYDAEVRSYHDKLYNNAVNLFASLAKEYNIPADNCISHKEIAGIYGGSDHTDPESLWNVFRDVFNDNKWTMNGFRNNIRGVMNKL